MKKIVLSLPASLVVIGSMSGLQAPTAEAATVTLVQASGTSNCTYSSISTDANGNLSVTCDGATPAPPPAPGPSPTPAPPAPGPSPTPTPPPSGNCPAQPANAKSITSLSRPPSGGSFMTGQQHYDNPATVTSDGTIGSNEILIIPFQHTGLSGTTRATLGPGNFGGVSRMQMVISNCPGSFDPAHFPVANTLMCTGTKNAPTLYIGSNYCPLTINSNYYVNVKPVSPPESTTAFLFNFN